MDYEQDDAAKNPNKPAPKDQEGVPATGSESNSSGSSTYPARTPVNAWAPISTELDEGEHLHDRTGANQSTQNLASFVSRFSTLDVYNVFFNYTTVMQRDPKKPIAAFKEHQELNRSSDIPCFDDTRIKVKHSSGAHDYYHANLVDGYRGERKYILAQTPMGDIEHFWRLIWEQRVTIIVNFEPMDNVRCPLYIPASTNEKMQHGDFLVENGGTANIRGTYDATRIYVKSLHEEKIRQLLHVAYYDWSNENGSPNRYSEVMNLLNDLANSWENMAEIAQGTGWLSTQEKAPPSPWFVCCQTGVDRSATFVALDILCRRLDDTLDKADDVMIDVEHTILKLRTQRAMAVQRPEQYLFLHLAAYEYAIRKHMLSEDQLYEDGINGFRFSREEPDSENEQK